MKEKTFAFISGSLPPAIMAAGKEILITLFLGVLGGFAGMFGKEIFNYLKKKLWLKQK
ncbi:hypothetical protein ACE38W_15030 [Chitinophaga sp. Hz27]|uniref:hypothetical protein n=1 Tax=Chitinophaga sp. Hz27 TaxID=3347169 RepID=UPI0035D7B3C2